MVVTALFSTTGAVNSGLYLAVGLGRNLSSTGRFPSVFGRNLRWREAPVGLLVTAAFTLVLVVGFNLDSIASLGSAVALIVFSTVTLAHFRLRQHTGASLAVLVVALASTLVTLPTRLP
jgi:L-asparagine transporter-like permease